MKDTMVKSYECPICHEELTAEKLVILPEDEHELHEELLGNIGDHMFSCHEAKRTPDAEQLKARIAELEKLAVVWDKYPDEKPPIDGRYLFWDSDGNAPHVLPYNDIVVRDNPGVFSTQTHWAYLPEPPEEK